MDIEVVRNDLDRVRVVDDERPVGDGQARIGVDAFALTTNNITYAVAGDLLRYWEFFPPAPVDPDAPDLVWGRIPVWGFGTVTESRSGELREGERLYGYFPMGSDLVVVPGRADERGVSDLAAHRAPMAGAYNRYVRTAADGRYRPDREAHQMVLYPLFFTSFLIDDFLSDNGDFGAGRVIVSSASAKTSIGAAFLAHERGLHVVGLTSPGNVAFVEGLGVYDQVVVYDDVDDLPAGASVYVDVAGNRDVRFAVHRRLGDELTSSMAVGDTHWDHVDQVEEDLPGPSPEFFFAPGQISKRNEDWGASDSTRR